MWSLYICPQDPDLMFAGTRPARVYGSHDGGRTWGQLALELPATTRITGIAVDPEDTETIYVGIEVGGLLRSVDGGRRWETINEGSRSRCTRALCVRLVAAHLACGHGLGYFPELRLGRTLGGTAPER